MLLLKILYAIVFKYLEGTLKQTLKSIKNHIYVFHVLAILTVLSVGYLFGTSILDNIHLGYLRYKMNDVVAVTNNKGSGGTGWVTKGASGKFVIITNAHVCGVQENGYVYVTYRGDIYLLKVIKLYADHDLCAIQAPESATSGFSIAFYSRYGSRVCTLGHPYLEPNTITCGEYSGSVEMTVLYKQNVSPEECKGKGYELIQADLSLAFFGLQNFCVRHLTAEASSISILPGNSGSPDVNIFGNVVGVAFAANQYGTRSYHVPLSELKKFLGEL